MTITILLGMNQRVGRVTSTLASGHFQTSTYVETANWQHSSRHDHQLSPVTTSIIRPSEQKRGSFARSWRCCDFSSMPSFTPDFCIQPSRGHRVKPHRCVTLNPIPNNNRCNGTEQKHHIYIHYDEIYVKYKQEWRWNDVLFITVKQCYLATYAPNAQQEVWISNRDQYLAYIIRL